MPVEYERTNWIDDYTEVNAEHLNNIEEGITDLVENQSIPYTDEEIDELLLS